MQIEGRTLDVIPRRISVSTSTSPLRLCFYFFKSIALLLIPMAFSSIPHADAQTPQSSTATIRKPELPKDARYWEYNHWYLEHSVVSLIVSGEDSNHLAEVLTELNNLKERHVLLGRVIVVGGINFARLDEKAIVNTDEIRLYGEMKRYLQKLGKTITFEEFMDRRKQLGISDTIPKLSHSIGLGSPTQVGDLKEILENLQVENSPTWIVRYKGKNYIYEGVEHLSRYFTSDGQFHDIED